MEYTPAKLVNWRGHAIDRNTKLSTSSNNVVLNETTSANLTFIVAIMCTPLGKKNMF